jgi:predicted tellurium resistance membrane protein TerC
VLIAKGVDHHLPRDCIYFAIAFSLGVEMLNIRFRKRSVEPVHLKRPQIPGG